MPFAEGPRNCIGYRFATMQVKAVLLHLYRNFTFDLCERSALAEKYKPAKMITTPLGVYVKVNKRVK